MPYKPETQESIYESIRDRIKGSIPGLTNFTGTSFNYVWVQGYSAEFRERELDKTATYLSGLIDYSGGPITEEDLEDLGISDIATVEELNSRMNDNDLDELVKLVGISRDQGTKATGRVEFNTQVATTPIPEGTVVGTQPDADGNFVKYVTDEDTSTANGPTTTQVDVTAAEVGTEYNVGPGSVTYMPNPPTGVQGVTDVTAPSGGVDEETNNELRNRAKNAIFEQSGGGTVEGIIGYIEGELDDVEEVDVIEKFTGDTWHGSYPHGHVVVAGGTESEIETAIEESRPVSVEHFYVPATRLTIRVDVDVNGTNIDTSTDNPIENNLREYIDGLGLGDSIIDVKLVQQVMNADSDITDIASIDVYIEDEGIFYDSSQDVYNLEQGDIMQDDGIVEVTGELSNSNHTFVEDTDYQEWDSSGGNNTAPHDSIDWSLAGDNPDVDTGETTTISYESGTDEYLVDDALITDGITNVDGTLNGSAHTFTESTDYEEIDIRSDGVINGIDWSVGGDSPDAGTDFTVTYDKGTEFDVTYLLDADTDVDLADDTLPASGTINVNVV